jgi:uncharacterized protein (DUF608 family)
MNTFPDPFQWPVLKTYDGAHLRRIAMPVGGIGTGTISLGGRGDWRDWEIGGTPAKGVTPPNSFFAIHARGEKTSVTRLLEGPIDEADYEGARGATVRQHGWPRFRNARFEAAYPLGQVVLEDDAVPVSVRLQAWNPMIPGDAENSGWPVAAIRFVVTNRSDEELQISICGNAQPFEGGQARNELFQSGDWTGIECTDPTLHVGDAKFGTLALATNGAAVSHRLSWPLKSWGDTLLDFYDDFSGDGELDAPEPKDDDWPVASLCARMNLAPGETESLEFLFAWRFPNRFAWNEPAVSCCGEECSSGDCSPAAKPRENIGNYYAAQWPSARAVVEAFAPRRGGLEASTVEFARAFYSSDLPEVVKEAAGFNLSTLRSQTCFRTPDGHFFGWEGCDDIGGCCEGSCTHVWNYEVATPYLYSSLARSMREVEFLHATRDDGFMAFRVWLPLSRAKDYPLAAADGQMGCLIKLYREWQLQGDEEWLRQLWPHARKALEWCWIDGGWDGDRDGVMEGCQHNTMDVEYYGPNPQMQGWYLGALRAAEEMARYVGEEEFANTCRALFEKGSRWTDENLWNGEYYEHEIRPTTHIAAGLSSQWSGAGNGENPKLQLGAGCLIDQLVGQYLAHACELGYLLDKDHIKSTLQSVVKYNRREHFWNHFNHMRSYALGDESAVLMASYPRGRRPDEPFPYYNEVMTGFEHTLAIGLMQEGEVETGLDIMRAIRARYDGKRRSPFDEAECGHHYARAMASWGAVLTLTGFGYSAVTGSLRFATAPQNTTWFWSNGDAWGTVTQTRCENAIAIELKTLYGELTLRRFELRDCGAQVWNEAQFLPRGANLCFEVEY